MTNHGPLPEPNQQLVPAPAKKSLRKQQPLSQPTPGMQPLGPLPANPPKAELQNLSIDQVNDTVSKVVQNHRRLFGTNPAPGLVFDVARGVGQGHVKDVDHLFDVPTTRMDGILRAMPAAPETPTIQRIPPVLQKQLDAITPDGLKKLQEQGLDPVKLLTLTGDKREIYVDRTLRERLLDRADKQLAIEQAGWVPDTSLFGRAISQISGSIKNIPFGIYKLAMAAGSDISNASAWPTYMIEKPFGLAHKANDLGIGFIAQENQPKAPLATAGLFKQQGLAIKQDFLHPKENIGYLTMDVFAIFSAGAGGYARGAAAAGRVAELGDASIAAKAATFMKEFKKRPYHPPAKIGFDSYQAYVPTFDNYLLRKLQLKVIDRANITMRARHSAESEFSTVRKSRMYDSIFSPERWTKRAMDNNMAMDIALETFDAHELTRLTTWQAKAEAMRSAIMDTHDLHAAWKAAGPSNRLTIGKAIQLIFTEDPNPIATWRGYHTRQIEEAHKAIDAQRAKAMEDTVNVTVERRTTDVPVGNERRANGLRDTPARVKGYLDTGPKDVGDLRNLGKEAPGLSDFKTPKAKKIKDPAHRKQLVIIRNHEAQLEALDRAVQLIQDGHPRFSKIVEKAYEVSEQQAKIKQEVLGYDPLVLSRHSSEVAAIARGENIVRDEGDHPVGITAPGEKPDSVLGAGVRQATNDLNREKRKMETLERKLAKPSKKAGVVADRPGVRAKLETQRAAVDAATDKLYVARHHQETLGTRVIPLDIYKREEGDLVTDDPAIAAYRGEHEPGYISSRSRATGDELSRSGRAVARITRGKYGISKPRQTVWRMTGTNFAMGENLFDTSDLLATELTKAVKAGVHVNQWQKIWDSSMDTTAMGIKDNPYLQPVRDVRSVPAHLKKFVDAMFEQKLDSKKMAQLDEEGLQKLHEWMYPSRDSLLKPNDPHVRWFDERFHADTIDKEFWMKADRLMSNVMAPINEPFRFLLIFGTPAYLLNAVGAAGTLMAKQGFLAIPNLGRSFASSRINGGELTRYLDVMAGSTHAMATVTEKNIWTKGSQHIAGAWQKATDLYFRRAAVIGRLREAGLWDDKLAPAEMLAKLKHEDNRIDVRNSMQKARNDMLDFEKMTWPEKATLRHLVFVYAFMRAGSIYSVRWLLEHPVEANVLTHVGQDRVQEIKRLVGETPSWFLNENYFPIGKDTVLNGVQLNIPDTLNQIAYPLASLGHPIPYQSTLDLLGPFPSMVQMAITGNQPGGQAVPKRTNVPLADSFLEMFAQTPPGFFMRNRKKSMPLPPSSVASGAYDPVAAAHSQESTAIKEPTFDSNTLWNGWGEVIFRSALPRHPNQAGMAARHWRDLKSSDPSAYWQHQVDLVHQMIGEQAKAVGKPAPPEVLDAVDLIAQRERYIGDKMSQWQKKHNQTLDKVGDRQIAAWTISFLAQIGRISPAKAATYRSALNQANDSRQAKLIWIGALRENGSKPWEQWVQKADDINWFAEGGFPDVLASLKERKLGDFTSSVSADQKTKWAYGRSFHRYVDGLADFESRIGAVKRGTEATKIRADMKDYIERSDHPVTINGVTFPSPVRTAFGRLSPDAQRQKILSASVGPWSSNDAFEKELLTGRKSSPDVILGYRNLASWLDSYQAAHPGEGVPGYLKKGYVDYLSKKMPAFGQDYLFARAPLAYRLQHVKPITQSQWAPEWKRVLDFANKRAVSLKKANFTQKGIADQWKIYDLPTVQKWIETFPAGFRRELGQWQAGHPHFLDSLVR